METGGTAGHVLLQRIVKLHYNWKYKFLRPTIDEVIMRYNMRFKGQGDPQAPATPATASPPYAAPMSTPSESN